MLDLLIDVFVVIAAFEFKQNTGPAIALYQHSHSEVL